MEGHPIHFITSVFVARATVDNLNIHACTLIRLFRPIGSHQHSVSQIHNTIHCYIVQNDAKCMLYIMKIE